MAEDNRRSLATDVGESDRVNSTDEAGERAQARTPWREGARQDDEATEGSTPSPPTLAEVYTKLRRLAERARQEPELQFRSLAHLMTVDLLREAFRQLRKNASPGIDGVTAREYEGNLEANLQDLHRRLREGRYRAQPVRRVYIEKEDGRQRPLGVPALEDKVVQRAALFVLEAISEQDFLPCSYGFRRRRSAHDALQAVQGAIVRGRTSYVLDADIKGYFDAIVRMHLMDFIRRRVVDGSLLRLLGKWLHVGVVDDGRLLPTTTGTPQGAVISPWMANLYLHHVLDLWVEREVKPRMRGDVQLIRYADDFIVCFQYRDDAERFGQALRKRFAKYGLELNEQKTRLIAFGRFAAESPEGRDDGRPGTFDFLGFTHLCAKNRAGKFAVHLRTARKRKGRTLKRIADWCRWHRHWPVESQRRALNRMLGGHYDYYGQRTNFASLRQVYRRVAGLWRKWLGRRSQRGHLTWEAFNAFLRRHPLRRPRITQRPYMPPLFGESS